MSNWFEMQIDEQDKNVLRIDVLDEIGGYGVSAKDFIDAVSGYQMSELELHINSPGGSVFEGWNIYNFINSLDVPVTVYVDGLCASIASVIAMAADTIVMPANALMMIHLPSTITAGDEYDIASDLEALKKIRKQTVKTYMKNVNDGIEESEMDELVRLGSWLDADDCARLWKNVIVEDASQMAANIALAEQLLGDLPDCVREAYNQFVENIDDTDEDNDDDNVVTDTVGTDRSDDGTDQDEDEVSLEEGTPETVETEDGAGEDDEDEVEITIVTVDNEHEQDILLKAADAAYDAGHNAGYETANAEYAEIVSAYEQKIEELMSKIRITEIERDTFKEDIAIIKEGISDLTENHKSEILQLQRRIDRYTGGLDLPDDEKSDEPKTWKAACAEAEKIVGLNKAGEYARKQWPDLYEAARKQG